MPLALTALLILGAQQHRPFLHMPSVDTFALHNPSGTTILPEGRLLNPAGWSCAVQRWPYGLALQPGSDTAFVASDGFGQWVDGWTTSAQQVRHFPVQQAGSKSNAGACAFSRDGKTLYWSSGETGDILVYNVPDQKITAQISLNVETAGKTFVDSYVSDMALSADGRYLYCADYANYRLAILDLSQGKVLSSVPVGRDPFAIALDGNRVFVANIGQFEYSATPLPTDGTSDKRGLTFPAFGYPSKEAENGVDYEGRHIPGLGSPYAKQAFSVYGIDVSDPASPSVTIKVKTGRQLGDKAEWGKVVGGSEPAFVLASHGAVWVSNSNEDTVQKIDETTGRIISTVSLEPSPLVHGYRGVEPTGLAISPDGNRLYVAEAGLNGISVLDTGTATVLGTIPTAWYPYRLAVSSDGSKIACICFKGFGNGPKGVPIENPDPYLAMKGVFTTIPTPSDSELSGMTQTVLANNGILDASADRQRLASPVWSEDPGSPSKQIKYVVFITKENHTFDTIFDRIKGSSNDPRLLRWGLDQHISANDEPTLEHVSVMRNHNKLARQFVVSDNFYMEPEASGVGHRWLVGIQPNNWCQMMYTVGFDFKQDTTAPGRRISFGSNASMTPEDYPEAGAMWDHLWRHGISFRNYGEGFEFAGCDEGEGDAKTGVREVVNIPMPKILYENTSRDFPNFNMNIPDMYRAEWFQNDIQKKYLSGHEAFPHFVNIAICNDHGTDPDPKKGYPYRASWMADNDAALGKIVDFLSHTPYWKNMAILVTQDDAGGENDHVDAQRSVLLVISPWVKHGFVSHRHTTITSMHRTMYEIFGLPPLNLFDALSNDFSDCFTDKPDFTPYNAEDVDHRLFDWSKVHDPKDPDYKIARSMPTIERDTWDRDPE